MNHPLIKKILPHFIAILIFIVVSVLFCKPVLEGNVLNQHDNIGWKGMAQNAFEYKEAHGHFPLWNPNLFSGMPNYQVAMEGKSVMPNLTKIFSLGLPKPINYFFLACICFYILCLSLRVRPIVAMLSSLGYAFATYNAVIIAAGHDTQMLATAFLPLLLAGLISIYEKKYWLGLALTTYAAYQQIAANHLQVTYYTLIIAIAITIGYAYTWIKNKDWQHFGKAAGLALIAAIIGVAGNALILKTTSEYAKYTMRGGKDIHIQGDSVTAAKTSGLDTSYAFEYSLGKAETATFIMPEAFGGSSAKPTGENSKVVSKLVGQGVSEGNAIQFASGLPAYWGKLYTSGPAYFGVFICLLGLIGFVIIRKPIKWALLVLTLFGIFMAWGKYFLGFNLFLFEHLPLYNKFRAPSYAQLIPQVAIGIMAALTLHTLLFKENSKEILQKNFKKIGYAVGGLFALLALMYFSMSYSSPNDDAIMSNLMSQTQNQEIANAVLAGLKADRSHLFGGQLLRTLGFSLVLFGVLFAFFKNWIKPLTGAVILLAVSSLELTLTSHRYLNEDNYVSSDVYQVSNFAPTAADQQILQDKDPNFRVFNMSGDRYNESRTSYYHKSIGGYHPAKLRIYQDVIERYLYNNPNPGILNMLNAKYILIPNQQNGQLQVMPNPDAYGPCWLVKNIKFVNDRVDAIQTIGKINLKDTAVLVTNAANNPAQPQWDSTASIRMTHFDNDTIFYEVNASSPQYAVFSEIYYPAGWNAYLDNQKTNYFNTDYVLRGMSVPAGKHTIKFVFEPASYKSGTKIMFISSILILVVFLGGLLMAWRQYRKEQT